MERKKPIYICQVISGSKTTIRDRMKRMLTFTVLLILITQSTFSQLSVREKRQMDRLYNAGIEQLMNSDYLNAISSFTKCIEIDDMNALAYLHRGRVEAALGQMQNALSDIDKALMFNNSLAEAYFYKGYFLWGSDTTGLSEEMLNEALSRGFENAQLYYYLGLTSLLEGDSDDALFKFNKAIDLDDSYALAYHDRAGIKKGLADYSGALYDYKAAVNYMEDFPLAYNNMGAVKMIVGDYIGAIEDFTTAISQDPGLDLAYNNRGYAYYQLGELDSAVVDFRNALDVNPAFMEARVNISSVLSKQGANEEAIEALNGIINDYPEVGSLYLNRGLIKELIGDVIGACEDWSLAFDLGQEEAAEYLKECK